MDAETLREQHADLTRAIRTLLGILGTVRLTPQQQLRVNVATLLLESIQGAPDYDATHEDGR